MSQTTALPSEWFAFHSLTVGCQHIFAVNSMLQISQSCKGKSEQVLYNTVFTYVFMFSMLDSNGKAGNALLGLKLLKFVL